MNDKKHGEFEEGDGECLMRGRYSDDLKDGMFKVRKGGEERE